MGQIFISYSSKDAEFAQKLFKSLEPFYDVWIDKDDIKGGSKWEKMIQDAVTACDVFLVIVSENSNDSNWVMRETILAENLKKFRVPIMYGGDMPFRLLELQYIDFRADYSGGLRDLLSVLQTKIQAKQEDKGEIDRLIGAGVLSHFDEDSVSAKNLFEQVTILQPELDSKLSHLNSWLKNQYSAINTEKLLSEKFDKINILEKAIVSKRQVYNDRPAYEWSLEINEPDSTISQIDFVKYILHPTFPQPERIVRDRKSKFRLESIGWGIFTVDIEIHFVDGSMAITAHDLTFESMDG